jgi:hypothetical protein
MSISCERIALIVAGAIALTAASPGMPFSSPRVEQAQYDPLRLEGRVLTVEGNTLTLLTRDGATVRVDLGGVPDIARQILTRGRDVEVFGVRRPDGIVWAHGIAVDYDAPVSASPGSRPPRQR